MMIETNMNDLTALSRFLRVETPGEWLEHAQTNLPLLLIDHAHCERKAAATAINFISKYPEKQELVNVMSPLAREELLHFEKVLLLLHERNLGFGPLHPSSYAQCLHKEVTTRCNQERLSEQLIIGAIIEARSCERFKALLSVLNDPVLVKFYSTLVKSEARHFRDYLNLAYLYGSDVDEKINRFLDIENELICGNDSVFRFHSGIPI